MIIPFYGISQSGKYKRAIRFFERLIALVLKFLNLMSAFAFHNFFTIIRTVRVNKNIAS